MVGVVECSGNDACLDVEPNGCRSLLVESVLCVCVTCTLFSDGSPGGGCGGGRLRRVKPLVRKLVLRMLRRRRRSSCNRVVVARRLVPVVRQSVLVGRA